MAANLQLKSRHISIDKPGETKRRVVPKRYAVSDQQGLRICRHKADKSQRHGYHNVAHVSSSRDHGNKAARLSRERSAVSAGRGGDDNVPLYRGNTGDGKSTICQSRGGL